MRFLHQSFMMAGITILAMVCWMRTFNLILVLFFFCFILFFPVFGCKSYKNWTQNVTRHVAYKFSSFLFVSSSFNSKYSSHLNSHNDKKIQFYDHNFVKMSCRHIILSKFTLEWIKLLIFSLINNLLFPRCNRQYLRVKKATRKTLVKVRNLKCLSWNRFYWN